MITMKKLYRIYILFGKKYRLVMLLAFLLIFCVGFINMSHQYFIGRTIDILAEGKWQYAFENLAMYTILFTTGQLMHTGINVIWIYLKTRFLTDVRKNIFTNIVHSTQVCIDGKSTSDLFKRINYDSEEVLSLIYHNIFYAIANVIKLVLGIYIIFSIKLEFGILCFISIPIITILDQKTKAQIRDKQAEYHTMEGKLIAQIHEFVNSFSEIVRLDVMDFFAQKIHKSTVEEKQAQASVAKCENNHDIMVDCALQISFLLIYAYGAICIFNESLTIGQIVMVIAYFNTCKSLFRGLFQRRNVIRKNMTAIDRIIDVLDFPQEKSGPEGLTCVRSINFCNVGFSYNDNKNVFSNILCEYKTAGTVRITGRNGDGKTTLLKLLVRLYSPSEGQILINNLDISQFNTNALRNRIGIVWQSPYVIPDTIKGNILLGKKGVTDLDIWNILEPLGLKDVIGNMPQGINTFIDPKNIPLSSGQLKRLTLARILIRKPDVLILDELTAPLDRDTAHRIISFLEKEYNNKMIFYISHDDKCTFPDSEELHIIDERVGECV